ncbi:ATP-binding protein [Pseudonocardia sp.]|uniref:ATP-binding protein n=1 Tax=Pseudonocardia sp. TaxID=60912 RepID=UPI00261C977D|nr:ATP-binding protein [Pseudonocardia sp.]
MRAPLTAIIDLPPEHRSVPTARRLLSELLGSWAADHYGDDANLLLSELVTNVVRHVTSGTKLVLEIHLTGLLLRVAVVDDSPAQPRVADRAGEEVGGHGLQLVASIADRWGSERHADGKRVWFELARAAS